MLLWSSQSPSPPLPVPSPAPLHLLLAPEEWRGCLVVIKAVVLTGVSQSVCQTSSTAPGFVSDNAFDAVFGNTSTSQSKLYSEHELYLFFNVFIFTYKFPHVLISLLTVLK